MNGLAYLRDNLHGAWQVMFGRPEGLNRLDVSLEGFWRSFGVILSIVPFIALSVLSEHLYSRNFGLSERLTGGSLVVYGMALLADWFAFPLVFAFLARPLGLSARYVPFVVARNWAALILAVLPAAADALHLLGILPSVALPVASLAAIAVAVGFSYVIARTALGVSVMMAIPIVILDFLMSFFVWSVFDRFL